MFFGRGNLSPDKGSHCSRSSSLKLSTDGNNVSNSDEPDASVVYEPLLFFFLYLLISSVILLSFNFLLFLSS